MFMNIDKKLDELFSLLDKDENIEKIIKLKKNITDEEIAEEIFKEQNEVRKNPKSYIEKLINRLHIKLIFNNCSYNTCSTFRP